LPTPLPRAAVRKARHVASNPTAGPATRFEEVVVFRELSPWHLVIILIALFVLFGYKKLPDATRSLGRSMRIFKSEVKGLHDDEPRPVESAATPTPAATPAATPPPPATQPQQAAPAPASPAASETRAEADRT
jgi:sec-independent protein translocase protein TatA